MGYIIDFMGVRDDFRPLFDFGRTQRIAFKQEQALFSKKTNSSFKEETNSSGFEFRTIYDKLQYIITRFKDVGIEDIIVVNNSPVEKFKLSCVKVIIPKLELVTVSPYKPSSLYEAKVKQTIFIIDNILKKYSNICS